MLLKRQIFLNYRKNPNIYLINNKRIYYIDTNDIENNEIKYKFYKIINNESNSDKDNDCNFESEKIKDNDNINTLNNDDLLNYNMGDDNFDLMTI